MKNSIPLHEKYKNHVRVFADKVKQQFKTKKNYSCDEFQFDSPQDIPSESNNLDLLLEVMKYFRTFQLGPVLARQT